MLQIILKIRLRPFKMIVTSHIFLYNFSSDASKIKMSVLMYPANDVYHQKYFATQQQIKHQ